MLYPKYVYSLSLALFFVVILASLAFVVSGDEKNLNQENHDEAEDHTPDFLKNTLFSTKTPYKLARHWFSDYAKSFGVNTKPIYSSSSATYEQKKPSRTEYDGNALPAFYPRQCKPSHLSIVLRHGTRFPSSGDVKRTARFLQKLQTIDLKANYDALKAWENDFTADNEKQLAENGATENIDLAYRYVQAFPDLFEESLVAMKEGRPSFEIMSSNTQRSSDSAAAFSKGLAMNIAEIDEESVTSMLSLRNDLLRFFERCSTYLYNVEENEDVAMVEFDKFRKGPEMKEAAKTVSGRLTKDDGENHLNSDDLRSIWVICGFETALREDNYTSPWCDAITNEESKVLEYTFDLKAFWKKSYGYTLNYEQSCPLLSDVMNNIKEAQADKSAPAVSLYFGHAETVLPLLTLIGLFQEEVPLRSDNFMYHRDTRRFRTSLITPFTANIAFVNYECEEGPQDSMSDWPDILSSDMVQVIMNEHPVPLPFTDKMAVDLHDFETQYYQFIHHCEFDKMCNNEPKKGSKHDEL